jgi:hypothetical protein
MSCEHRWPVTLTRPFPLAVGPAGTRIGLQYAWRRAWRFYHWLSWAPTRHVGHRLLQMLALGTCLIAVPLLSPLMFAILAAVPIIEIVKHFQAGLTNRALRSAPDNPYYHRRRAGQRPSQLLRSRSEGRATLRYRYGSMTRPAKAVLDLKAERVKGSEKSWQRRVDAAS